MKKNKEIIRLFAIMPLAGFVTPIKELCIIMFCFQLICFVIMCLIGWNYETD